MSKKNIAFLSRRVTGFGATTTELLEHSRRLTDLNYRVVIFGEQLDTIRINNAGGESRRLFRLPIKRWRRPFFAHRINKKIKTDQFDLIVGHGDTIHQHILSMHNCVHLAHERIYQAPIHDQGVAAMHKNILSGGKFLKLVANSNLMKQDFITRFHIPEEKIDIIYPGFKSDQFNLSHKEVLREKARSEFGFDKNELVLGLSTSGDFKKRGVSIFIKVLENIQNKLDRPFKAMIIGGEKNISDYKNRVRDSGLGEIIRFFPPIKDVQKYYHAMDLLVYPALFEEFGQTVQEAFACGTPVILSRFVGAHELLSSVPECIVTLPQSALFEERILRLLKHPMDLEMLGKKGAQAVAHNTWDFNFQKTIELYSPFISKKLEF